MSQIITNPTNITEFVLGQGYGIKGLVDLGLESVPNQYIQPPEGRFHKSKAYLVDSIPIIDFTNLDDPNVEESIFRAAKDWGIFQIVNHGIPLKVLEDLKYAVPTFFELPVEDKKRYLKENSDNNIVKLGTSFRPQIEVLEWRDYLNLLYASEDEINAYWPPVCKDQALEYMKSSQVLIRRIIEVLLKKINVNEIDKTIKECELMASIKLKFNYYPHCPNPKITHGLGPHCDISYITILLQDEIGGLYVRKNIAEKDDGWVHVPPIEGALLVNIGDALQIVSNDKYKSTEHRVMANKEESRISIAMFVDPKADAIVGPWPQVLETYGEQPKYKQVVFSDYCEHFFSKAYDGHKTTEFAKI